MVKGRPQAAMIVILKRHEAEWLEHAIVHLPHRAKDFGHTMHRTSLRLKGNFDEVAFAQRLGEVQEASGGRNGLEFRFGTTTVFEPDRS